MFTTKFKTHTFSTVESNIGLKTLFDIDSPENIFVGIIYLCYVFQVVNKHGCSAL